MLSLRSSGQLTSYTRRVSFVADTWSIPGFPLEHTGKTLEAVVLGLSGLHWTEETGRKGGGLVEAKSLSC